MAIILTILACLALVNVIASSSLTLDEFVILEEALRKNAGIYLNGSSNAGGKDLTKTVILTSTNYGYISFVHNLNCFLARLGMKGLVFSLDQHSHDHIKASVGMTNLQSILWVHGEGIKEESSDYRSAQFNQISVMKMQAVWAALILGYDVLFIDTDIALVRDPLQYLLWENVDYVHSVNTLCFGKAWDFYSSSDEGNTGFYFIRSNERTIQLYKNFSEIAPKHLETDDQTVFWGQLRGLRSPVLQPLPNCRDFVRSIETANTLITCPLDPCAFSVGVLFYNNYVKYEKALKERNIKMVALHANYLIGSEQKMAAMKRRGFWLTDHVDGTESFNSSCAAFESPL